jgi:hypothetical protein
VERAQRSRVEPKPRSREATDRAVGSEPPQRAIDLADAEPAAGGDQDGETLAVVEARRDWPDQATATGDEAGGIRAVDQSRVADSGLHELEQAVVARDPLWGVYQGAEAGERPRARPTAYPAQAQRSQLTETPERSLPTTLDDDLTGRQVHGAHGRSRHRQSTGRAHRGHGEVPLGGSRYGLVEGYEADGRHPQAPGQRSDDVDLEAASEHHLTVAHNARLQPWVTELHTDHERSRPRLARRCRHGNRAVVGAARGRQPEGNEHDGSGDCPDDHQGDEPEATGESGERAVAIHADSHST